MSRIKDEIWGQDEVIETAERALGKGGLTGLVLFVGPEGVGKKKAALALAQTLVCENPKSPCGSCGPCQRIQAEASESLLMIQPDGAQIKVDQAREIIRFCQLSHPGKARVVILDQAEKLNPQAANALLKVLEEPPANTYFFFIAPHPKSVLPTLRSRAMVLRFGPIPTEILTKKLKVPAWVIQASGGRMDRVEMLQNEDHQELRTSAATMLISAFGESAADMVEVLKTANPGRDGALATLRYWKEFLRDAWLKKSDLSQPLHPDLQENLQALEALNLAALDSLYDRAQTIEKDFRNNIDPQVALESFLRQAHQLARGTL